MIQRIRQRDPIYYTCVVLLAACALGFFLAFRLTGLDILVIRPASALIGLFVALGLSLRGRNAWRITPTLIGAAVVLLCGAQIAMFVSSGAIYAADNPQRAITQNFAGGMFCIGSALVLDGILPARWGRHFLFGLLGAIAASIGLLGILGLLSNLPPALETDLLRGLRLPSALILVFGGIALLTGARLRGLPAQMLDDEWHDEEFRDRTGVAAGLAMLVITFGTTLLIWREARNEIAVQDDLALGRSIERISNALETNALGPTTLLDGLRGLFGASSEVEQDEWNYFTDRLKIHERYTGIVGVGYAMHVRTPRYEKDGKPVLDIHGRQVAIWPGDRRDEYFPVVYRTPEDGAYSHVIGYDLATAPQAAITIARALTTGEEAISARIDFANLADPQRRVGFVLVMPLLATKLGDGAQGNEVSGLVYAAIDMQAVVAKSLQDVGAEAMQLRIVDVDAEPSGSLLYKAQDFDASQPSREMRLALAGRSWDIVAHRTATVRSPSASRPAVILAGGTLCALLLFAITWVLAGHRARAMHLASKMNAELRKSQRSYRAITDTANVGIVTADSSGRVLYMNPSAASSFDVDAAAMVGQPLTMLMPERYHEAHDIGVQRTLAAGVVQAPGRTLELEGMRRDGSEFPVELLTSLWSSDGQTYFTAFVRDITKRKRSQAELEQRTRELERSNADLEQFAYVASHDLQEPLRMVASYVQLLARRYQGRLDTDADEFIGFAVDGATRMQRLIQDLLAYARLGRSGKTPIATHVGDCVESAIAHLQEAILESGARVRVNADCQVVAIPSQLVQVFQNLIGNALKFRNEATPEVDIGATREGANWHFRVSDNGIGIAPQHTDRVFAIFQRLHTRREYVGTGIGLAICRKIIDSLGGSIWVESAPGSGSTFHFTLPAA